MRLKNNKTHSISIGGVEYRPNKNGIFDMPADVAAIALAHGFKEVGAKADTEPDTDPDTDQAPDSEPAKPKARKPRKKADTEPDTDPDTDQAPDQENHEGQE